MDRFTVLFDDAKLSHGERRRVKIGRKVTRDVVVITRAFGGCPRGKAGTTTTRAHERPILTRPNQVVTTRPTDGYYR